MSTILYTLSFCFAQTKENIIEEKAERKTDTGRAQHKQYKIYRNKLTVILRQAKRDYYNKRLLENKNDNKSIWKILKEVIANNPEHTSKVSSFYINDSKVVLENLKEVVNEFKSCFVNVGPNLTKTIKQHNNGQAEGGWDGESKVLQSIFVGEVNETEIICIVTI